MTPIDVPIGSTSAEGRVCCIGRFVSYCSPIVLLFDIHSPSSSRSLVFLVLRAGSLRHSHFANTFARILSLFPSSLLFCHAVRLGHSHSRIPLPHWGKWLRHPRERRSQRRCAKVKPVGNRFKSIRAQGTIGTTECVPVAPDTSECSYAGRGDEKERGYHQNVGMQSPSLRYGDTFIFRAG